MKLDNMGEARGIHRRENNCTQSLFYENLKERDHVDDLSINKLIILKWISERCRIGGYGLD
jgi:hypothetical protein